jgi:hypothetical protein
MNSQETHHWLDRYANSQHNWTISICGNGNKCYRRPLGLVETSFDSDGTYYGGRADMTASLKLEIRHTLGKRQLRERVASAWALLRLQHVLLMSRIEDDTKSGKRCFVVDVPKTADEVIHEVERNVVWVEDFGFDDTVNEQDLHHHALNVSRIVQPKECLSKLHVLPPRSLPNGHWELRFLIVMAHQISDGLSGYNWFRHFIKILNTSGPIIKQEITASIQLDNLKAKLPPAQEDLYPKVAGNLARQRWFWAIMRVLRHMQKTMPPTFINPLRRPKRLEGPVPLPSTYSAVFDYSTSSRPPMSSGHVSASLTPAASARLISLCRSIHVSIGAGCFALAGLSMMKLYESLHPESSLATCNPAFGASFPLNPRAFFDTQPQADSCMLAFSEGIIMPFLPSTLPVEGRFKLVACHANRELRVYQKRLKDNKSRSLGSFDKHSPARLLATGYLAQMERVEAKMPEERRTGFTPQGELKPALGQYGATCGVSSVGSLKAFFRPGEHDLDDMEDKDFVADYRGLEMGVRARDNEFLVGSSTDASGCVGFGVSYDENAISQEAAQKWAETIRGLLEPDSGPRL